MERRSCPNRDHYFPSCARGGSRIAQPTVVLGSLRQAAIPRSAETAPISITIARLISLVTGMKPQLIEALKKIEAVFHRRRPPFCH